VSDQQYDVVVIGAGPGGYVAAIRAAQLGANVAVVEKGTVGGTCLNVGCIPTKTWVHSAHVLKMARHGEQFGVLADGVSFDLGRANRHKEKVVSQMTKGVGGLLKANGVDLLEGTAQFEDANTLSVDGDRIGFANAVVATGSYPTRLPVEGADDSRCVDSTGLLAVEEMPKRLLVVGGGVIGCEFASIFAEFGSEVALVEFLPGLVMNEDPDATKALEKSLKAKGVQIHTGVGIDRFQGSASGVTGYFGEASFEADIVLIATGRAPMVEGLNLEAAGVQYDPKKGIAVDEHMRTNVSNIYAIGDCAGKFQLAHTASREGEVAVENALGHEVAVDYKAVPRVVYTDPEIAAVGLTEAQAREEYGDDLQVGTFPFAANSRSATYGERDGFVKVISEPRYGELLGVTMVGAHVSDMLSAGVIALDAECTVETVAFSIQAHPTLAEAIKEAALDAMGQVIYMPPTKRPRATVGAGA
jgi:dihydrolipoamide dehydrogenase